MDLLTQLQTKVDGLSERFYTYVGVLGVAPQTEGTGRSILLHCSCCRWLTLREPPRCLGAAAVGFDLCHRDPGAVEGDRIGTLAVAWLAMELGRDGAS